MRRLGLVVLALAILAWPAERDLRAQPPTRKADEKKIDPPRTLSTTAPVLAQPSSPTISLPNPPQKVVFVPDGGTVSTGRQRFQFNISPQTPLKDLLPTVPKAKGSTGPLLGEDLARVPEVEFEAALAKKITGPEATKHIAHQIAKINHLNAKKTDGFLEALRDRRTDLNGLAFAMGDACRTTGERSQEFNRAVQTVRNALQVQLQIRSAIMAEVVNTPQPVPQTATTGGPAPPLPAGTVVPPAPIVREVVQQVAVAEKTSGGFWDRYQKACVEEDKSLARADRAQREHVTVARIAALMQMLAPESPAFRLGLVKYLAGVSHVEATKALARLAIFTAEDEVRRAAVDALKVRRERDYTAILTAGLRYPYPAVARRAADAIAKLERKDLLPRLVALLEEPDPRAPVIQQVGRREVPVVRELVRVNHHRNCLLCHAPGNTGTVAPDTLTAGVPIPGEPLAPPSQGYQTSFPDVTVRLDVTYLRQDFSVLQPVADAHPWPEMQRFDFLVRNRALTEEEAAVYREQLESREEGRLSPYRRAALAALRELTGLEAAPTATAWRRLLKLPAR
jgi:hypothetical protein